jgi:hypothetical protein
LRGKRDGDSRSPAPAEIPGTGQACQKTGLGALALIADLDRPKAGQIADAGLIASGAAARMAFEFNAERAAKQRLKTKRQQALKEAAKRAAEKSVDAGRRHAGGRD